MTADRQRVTVVGSGYVGTVAAAALALVGHDVVGVEIDEAKLEKLSAGVPPFHEPGLDELLAQQVDRGFLRFTDDYDDAVDHGTVIFLCVGTPPGEGGRADMGSVERAARAIGASMTSDRIIVTKSTVPIGSGRWLETLVEDSLTGAGSEATVSVVSNPEFLREGSAIDDFLYPDRVVLGSDSSEALEIVEAVYRPILDQTFTGGRSGSPPSLVTTDLVTAETVKYASNAFLATKISFINEMSQLSDAVGADVTEVATAIGLDARIGPQFLRAGIGWGGSCFGKDLAALAATAREHGVEPRILDAVHQANAAQIDALVKKLQTHLGSLRGRRIALLGLAFKPGTDDLRDAPSLKIVDRLHQLGALITVHDPVVHVVPDGTQAKVAESIEAAVSSADAVVLVTEWSDYLESDLTALAKAMAGDLFLDGRNVFDPAAVTDAGLTYVGIGR